MLRGGILHGKSLHGRIAAKQGTDFCGNFGKDGVVVVVDVGTRLPEGSTGKVARNGIKRFDVLDETGLALNLGDDSRVEERAEFRNFSGSDIASDDASDHECLLRRMGEAVRRGDARGLGEWKVTLRRVEVKKKFLLEGEEKGKVWNDRRHNAYRQ